jgi:CDP-diacylglycerol--glycerol-3-phosphate 3-phosphatidyltransferase
VSQESVSAVSQTECHVSNWNLPNILTVVRIIAVPFFVVVLLAGGTFGAEDVAQRWLAFALFIAAMITDWADGYLARSRNLITSFGKIADPIADKLLTGAAFITLSWLGELWWWVTAVILLREWGITIMRFFVIKYGVMAANKGGKIKTVLQTIALVVMLLPLGLLGEPWLVPGWVLMAAVTAITVWTGVVYVRDAHQLRQTWLAQHPAQS